jgi:hypothetical protein
VEGLVSETPAEILRRLRPIPTYTGHPTTKPQDIRGVDPTGRARTLEVVGATAPVLLLFLSAGCLGCRDLWEGLGELHAGLEGTCRLAVVTKSPGDEDPAAIASLAGAATAESQIAVVMSTQAYRDYRVGGPPFLVVADGERVLTEGVAWGIHHTRRAALDAL